MVGLPEQLIPPAFNKHIIEEKLRKATILSPLSTHWRVGIEKEADGYYFEGGGWREFVEAHGLDLGYLITFSYKGDGIFTFTAFDHSACQIEFPCKSDQKNVTPKRQNLEEVMCRYLQQKSQVQGTTSTTKKGEDGASSSVPKLTRRDSESFRKKGKRIRVPSRSIRWSKKTCTDEPNYSLERVMQAYNFEHWAMDFPKGFCDLIGVSGQCKLKLMDPRGHLWPIKLYKRNGGTRLGQGWRDFSEGNKLKMGDVCVFEPEFKGRDLVVKVHIRNK